MHMDSAACSCPNPCRDTGSISLVDGSGVDRRYLPPEFMAGRMYIAAFRIANSERGLSDSFECQKKKQKKKKTTRDAESDGHWDTIQGGCLGVNHVLIQTKDDWTYPVQTSKVFALIETCVIRSFNLRT